MESLRLSDPEWLEYSTDTRRVLNVGSPSTGSSHGFRASRAGDFDRSGLEGGTTSDMVHDCETREAWVLVFERDLLSLFRRPLS